MIAEGTPLAAAQADVERGDYRRAIARLTEANRRAPSGAVEQRLVELRHGGLASLPPARGAAAWPPPLADPSPGLRGVP